MAELSIEVRREKALKSFVERYGEEAGPKVWEDYCRKSGLLPKKTKAFPVLPTPDEVEDPPPKKPSKTVKVQGAEIG